MMDIKELAKKLCDESGCHHKCKEIDECVVMEEAEELFKQALVEGVNRRIDKDLRIREMAKDICKLGISCEECTMLARKTNQTRERYCKAFEYAKRAYNAGYRKQSEGEWIEKNNHKTIIGKTINGDKVYAPKDHCSKCGVKSKDMGNYCSYCGAKMKGGE